MRIIDDDGRLRDDAAFQATYNHTWIIERHGYRTPAQVRALGLRTKAGELSMPRKASSRW